MRKAVRSNEYNFDGSVHNFIIRVFFYAYICFHIVGSYRFVVERRSQVVPFTARNTFFLQLRTFPLNDAKETDGELRSNDISRDFKKYTACDKIRRIILV